MYRQKEKKKKEAISAVGRFGLIIPPHTMYGGILFSGSP